MSSASLGSGAEPRRQTRTSSPARSAASAPRRDPRQSNRATLEHEALRTARSDAASQAHRSIRSSSETARTSRAGEPITSRRGGTSRVTTEPAATNASSPISIAGRMQRAAPNTASPSQGRSLQRLIVAPAAHRVVVGGEYPRRDEDLVLDGRMGGHVAAGLDPHPRADRHVVVDRRSAPDDRALADPRPLAHVRLVADDRARADLGAGQHHGPRADRGARGDGRRRIRGARSSRARSERRGLADDRAVLDAGAGAYRDALRGSPRSPRARRRPAARRHRRVQPRCAVSRCASGIPPERAL